MALVLVSAVGCLAGCATDRTASDPASTSRTTVRPGERKVRVLQMNLCDSGRAACYTSGRSVSKAVSLIHHDRPTMVTVNEVCRGDVSVLEQALSSTFPAARVAKAFASARNRATQAPVRCQGGQRYGDSVLLAVASSAPGSRSYRGVYPVQDPHDVEQRVWVCIGLARRLSACTTHTASTSDTFAIDQCRYLLGSAVPMFSGGDGGNPVILGADLNLAAGGSPSPQSCLPSGYQRVDDDALQDVVVSPGVEVRSHSVLGMDGTTDHPALLVEVVLPRR